MKTMVSQSVGNPLGQLKCPHHNVTLAMLHHKNVVIHRCGDCKGIWISGQTVRAVLGSLEVGSNQQGAGMLCCPDDRQPLVVVRKKGVTIDVCLGCGGVWLDHGELERLIQSKKRSSILDSAIDGVDLIPNPIDLVSSAGDLAGDVLESVFSGIGEIFSGL